MSEQGIVDCLWSNDTQYYLHGCDGGFADKAMDRIINDFGGRLPQEEKYPYVSQNMKRQKDKWVNGYNDHKLKSYSKTKPNSIGELKYALLDGPVTVAIAVTDKMVFYSGGIFDDANCKNEYKALGH